ncbi:33 kDa chaperonin [Thiomonas sp. X19]|uniref:Hsp33 family molecular chaperone HslO n=1 Tax=Thiomonas sp. X19 TaxID=1050370 RepID=UPI000B7058F8|nr:Hsp33 family molecular chaperone HslO [Thiomonas sp. X19]SCC95413.1 33 kDa chaperonin [Thiomonas sp. X19]
MSDTLFKFMLGAGHVRGVVVRLQSTWQEMRRRRQHDALVQSLLGEMTVASALLAGSLKFDGTLILQIQGDGPLQLAVAECQPDFGLRATVKTEGLSAQAASLPELANAHGLGRCVITLDPRNKMPGQQPYQGIVSLADADGEALDSMATVLQQYLAQSEQIPSWLILASNDEAACGLLLQRMPDSGGKLGAASSEEQADEDFSRAVHLASTLSRDELLRGLPEELLHKLFWQEEPRVFNPQAPHFHCTCSKLRVADMLRMLGQGEVESVLKEQGEVDVTCEFCGAQYAFDLVDAAQLFRPEVNQPPAPPQRQ